MSDRNIGMEILEGIREIKSYKRGQSGLRTHKLKAVPPLKKKRAKPKLSQATLHLKNKRGAA